MTLFSEGKQKEVPLFNLIRWEAKEILAAKHSKKKVAHSLKIIKLLIQAL